MSAENLSIHDSVFYIVHTGDSLSKIIRHYYGSVSLQQQNAIISQIQADNPEVTNPEVIYPGQALIIDIPQQYCAAPGFFRQTPRIKADKKDVKPLKQYWGKATPREKDLLSSLAPVMLSTGTAGLMMVDRTFKSNVPLISDMAENYNDYKSSNISKGQYDYRRQRLLYKLRNKLGPSNVLLNGTRSHNEVLRISRTKGAVPTVALTRQMSRMTMLSKVASRGGVVLSVVGLGVACYEIANTSSKQVKNEILVESLFGAAGGALAGGVATIVLVGTPVGWVAALAIGVGAALTGYGAGAAMKELYSLSGVKIDFASSLGVSRICR